MIAYGLAYLGVSVAPWFPLVLLLVVVAHIAGGGNWVCRTSRCRPRCPDELRGRVFATDMMIATLAVSVSLLVVGVLEGHVATRVLVFACGAVTLLYGIGWRLLTARVRRAIGWRRSVAPVPAPASAGPSSRWRRATGRCRSGSWRTGDRRSGWPYDVAMVSFRADPVHVRVPATSANLGPGFDALGLALGLYDDVTAG